MRRLVALAACAAIAGLAALACGDDAPERVRPEPADLLRRAAERMDGVQAFRFDLEHDGGFTEIVRGIGMERAEGAVAGDDRMEVEVDARAGPLNITVGIVVLPGEAWITNPLTGRWEREEISLDAFFDPARGVTALMRAIEAAAITGLERVDGIDAWTVEAAIDSGAITGFVPGAGPGRTVTGVAWIGADDPLVHRIEIRGAVLAGESAGLVRRLDLRDFDEAIEIVAPE